MKENIEQSGTIKKSTKYYRTYVKKNPWMVPLCSARGRCNHPSCKSYKDYGAKGIKCLLSVLDIKFLWFRDKADEMEQPSLDRIDPKKGYDLVNARFIENRENYLRNSGTCPVYQIKNNEKIWFRSISFAEREMNRQHGIQGRITRRINSYFGGYQEYAYGCKWERAEKVATKDMEIEQKGAR